MKNILVIGLLLVLAGGAYLYVQGSNEKKQMMEQKAMEEQKMFEEKMLMEKQEMEKKAMEETSDALMEKDTMQKESESMEGDEAMMQKDESVTASGETTMMKKGSYIPYAANKLAMASEGDVVLFFRASWCPSCKTLDADIKANMDAIPSGVTILDVNYDTETALKQKYGVTTQHTLVQVDATGNQIAKWSGSPSLALLVGKVQ